MKTKPKWANDAWLRPAPASMAIGLLLLTMAGGHWMWSCGPFFPNWLLMDADQSVLSTPEARFDDELRRMRLVETHRRAKVADDHASETQTAELADLREALRRSATPESKCDEIIQRHEASRQKLQQSAPGPADAHAPDESRTEPSPGNAPLTGTAAKRAFPNVEMAAGLPGEFADYFRGAIAWRRDDKAGARAAWATLLERPAGERHFKSTWAAYMLGRSWEDDNRRRAIGYFRMVRELAGKGFADSAGLAVASLGMEARLHWRDGRYDEATDLYLEQAAAGDPSARQSLRFVGAMALRQGDPVLSVLARHPRARRVVTAFVISGGFRRPPIDVDGAVKESALRLYENAAARWPRLPPPAPSWHTLREPVLLWLEAVERVGVKDVESAEQLVLAAYQAGQMDLARRWLKRAQTTPVTRWIESKLLLRDGRMDEAARILASIVRDLHQDGTNAPSTNAPTASRLFDNLYVDSGPLSNTDPVPAARQARAELALFQLTRRQYVEALDALLRASPNYWMDAAYVAERILTVDELKAYVDRSWPGAPTATAPAGTGPAAGDAGQRSQTADHDDPGINLRYLLGRRLARTGRLIEARSYFPREVTPRLDVFLGFCETARRPGLPSDERARVLFEAARILRAEGLELTGTEVGPDWAIHAGNFEDGVTTDLRESMQRTNRLAATADEIERGRRHAPESGCRWHYRHVASTRAWEAAQFLREDVSTNRLAGERADSLFDAALFLREHRIARITDPNTVPALQGGGKGPGSPGVDSARAPGASESASAPAPARPPVDGTRDPASRLLWERGYTATALAWDAARLMPDNDDETARVLCLGGSWIKTTDPAAADLLYKALVRRCRKTRLGAEADRLRWFPRTEQ